MKTLLPLLIFLILYTSFKICGAQAGEWTWMLGDSSMNSMGSYGMKGIPSPTNKPAATYACGYWTDTAGNFWIFGGVEPVSGEDRNTLWKFDPQALMWTWMNGNNTLNAPEVTGTRGIYSYANTPAGMGYGMFTWTTADNHLWLFGGDYGPDLWQYDPAINNWAWMGSYGPPHYGIKGVSDTANKPGLRFEGNCAWMDTSGNFWLFGGENSGGSTNDVWKYNLATGIWTWMSGSANTDDPGSYGTIGQPSVTNYPAARSTNLFWKDKQGNFWLAGGMKFANDTMFQDVWNFSPQTLQWTWVKGIEGEDTTKIGTRCMGGVLNKDGPRYENRANWQICDELIITFGGFPDLVTGVDANDLWAYQSGLNEWIKIDDGIPAGNYGVQGVAAPGNWPVARAGSVGFIDKNNNLWMFGGAHSGPGGAYAGGYNDLWQYVPDTACLGSMYCSRSCEAAPPHINAQKAIFCAGDSAQICAPAGYLLYQWNTGDTGVCTQARQQGSYYLMVTDSNGCTAWSDTTPVSLYPAPVDSISSNKTVFCTGDSVQICALAGFASLQWNEGLTGAGNCVYVRQAGNYYVNATDTNGCVAESNHISISVYSVPSVSIIVQGDTLSSFGAVSYQWYFNNNPIPNATGSVYIASQSGEYAVEVTDTNGCTALSNNTQVVITGVTQINGTEELTVYPNPFTNSIFIRANAFTVIEGIEIYDITGRIIMSAIYQSPSNLIHLEPSDLARGFYYLKIKACGKYLYQPIIKQ